MTNPSDRLTELGLRLPEVVRPVGIYTPAVVVGNLVLTSGQIPLADGKPTITGRVGDTVSLEQAQKAAETCVLNAVAAAAAEAGGIDNLARMVRLCVYVASAPAFTDQPKVANAASHLLGEIFGNNGVHVRSAVGVASLPLNVPVELELVAQVKG